MALGPPPSWFTVRTNRISCDYTGKLIFSRDEFKFLVSKTDLPLTRTSTFKTATRDAAEAFKSWSEVALVLAIVGTTWNLTR